MKALFHASFRTFLPLVLMVSLLSSCGQTQGSTWQEPYDQGAAYLEEGSYEEAIAAFTDSIALDDQHPEAFLARGSAYAQWEDTEDNLSAALADYEAALALDETLSEAWLGLADVHIRLGDCDKALEVLKEALDKTGQDSAIASKLSQLEEGSFADSSGNVRRKNGYDSSGTLLWYHIYDYNDQGQRIAATSYDASGNQTGHIDLKYDSQGHMLVNFFWNGETGVVGKIENELNEQGDVAVSRQYLDEGVLETRYTYDQESNTVWEDHYSMDGTFSYTLQIEYDDQDRAIKEWQYGPDETLYSYLVNTYNANGDKESQATYDAQGELSWRLEYRYDEEGNYLGYDKYDKEGNLVQSIPAQP